MKLQIFKIVIATVLAIAVAQLLRLDNATSAGIVAMLSVLDTRKASLVIGWQRLVATLIALALGSLSFFIFGFHLGSFALYLALFVSLAYYFDARPVIAPCSVLVTHVWLSQDLSLKFFINEFLLMLIGAGFAILLNSYMPSQQEKIHMSRQRIEETMRLVLFGLSTALYEAKVEVDHQQMSDLQKKIQEGKNLVYREMENRLFSQTNYDLHYLDMRQNQTDLLATMLNNLEFCHLELEEAKLLASLFALTANQLDEANPATYLLADIETMLTNFRHRDLPKTRQEFETRAILFQLLTDLMRFIQLKIDFFEEYQASI